MKTLCLIALVLLASSVSAEHRWDWLEINSNTMILPDSGEGTWNAKINNALPSVNAHGDAVNLNKLTTATVEKEEIGNGLPSDGITVEAVLMIEEAHKWGGIITNIQDNEEDEFGWALGNYYNKWFFALAAEGGNGLTYMNDNQEFLDGMWYHVVATYDGNTMRLYVNGRNTVYNDEAQSGAISYRGDEVFSMGAYKDEDEYYPMAGEVRWTAIGNKALTSDEVKDRYEYYIQSNRPRSANVGDCVVVYDQCDYQGNDFQICDDVNDIDLDLVASARIPEGKHLTVYEETNYQGSFKVYTTDQPCFEHDFSFLQMNQKAKTGNL